MAKMEEDLEKTNIWLLDSACSHHLTSNKGIFTTLDNSFQSKVKIGDENFLKVLEVGIVKVETTSGYKSINSVHYVPKAN